MKKILFISNVTYRITNFTKGSYKSSQTLGLEFHLASNLSRFDDSRKEPDIILHHIDIPRNPINIKLVKAYKQLKSLHDIENFDIIHCNTPSGGILGRLLSRKYPTVKTIYTAHGFHFFKGAPIINNYLYKYIEKELAKFTDVIITINKEDFLAAKKFTLKKNGVVEYIPGVGIDTKINNQQLINENNIRKQLNIEKTATMLISLGELNKNKNTKIIIQALKKLNNKDVHYIVCGVGPKDNNLKKLVKKYNLEKNIHFLGYRNDAADLLKAADIYVLPSFREGLSRSLMEAMSAGLPCIVSNIRGNRDLIENELGGYLHGPKKVNELVNHIDFLHYNKTLRKKMGENNLNKIKNFDFEIVSENIFRIYQDLLSRVTET